MMFNRTFALTACTLLSAPIAFLSTASGVAHVSVPAAIDESVVANGELPIHLSPLLPQAIPTIALPRGAAEVGFLPDLLDRIGGSTIFSLTQFPMPSGNTVDLVLSEFDVLGDLHTTSVMKVNAQGETYSDYAMRPNIRSFRGTIAGEADSLVFLSFGESMVSGFINVNGRMHSISNGPDGSMPVVITDIANLPEGAINWTEWQCGTDSIKQPNAAGTEEIPAEGGIAALPICKTIEMAFETDNEFRGQFSNTQNALDYGAQIAAGINVIYYADENVFPVLNFLRVWDVGTTDPWSSGDMCGQLGQFADAWGGGGGPAGSTPRDLAHIISSRNLGGGCAYLSVVCNADNGFACSGNIEGSFPFPNGAVVDNNNQNWDIIVCAHEMGHNSGCAHTHNIGVDGCGNGNCAGASNGTIMSYCHLCPGGLANIVLHFAGANITQMDNHIGGAGCVTAPCPITDPTLFKATDGTFLDACVLTWNTPSIPGLGYNLQRKLSSAAVGAFASLVNFASNANSTFADVTATPGFSYAYRIRSIKADGTPGEWVGPEDGYIGLAGPSDLEASDGLFDDKIALTWLPAEVAPTKYRVFRSTLGGAPLWIDETTEIYYDDTGTYTTPDPDYDSDGDGTPGPDPIPATEVGVVYRYEVRGILIAGVEEAQTSGINDNGTRAFPAPTNFKASGDNDGATPPFTDRVKLSWSGQGPSTSWQVYRATDGGDFELIETLAGSANNWSDFDVFDEVNYIYKLKGFNSLAGFTAPSLPDVGFKLSSPQIVSAADGESTTGVALRWNHPANWIPGGYAVWRKVQGPTPWPIAPIAQGLPANQLTYTDTTAVTGEVYVYAIAAFSDTFNTLSYRGSTNTGYAAPAAPTNVAASDGTFAGYVKVTWTAPSAAQLTYKVLRRRLGTAGNFAQIGTTSQRSYFDASATAGIVFEYRIRAVATNGAVSVASSINTGYKYVQDQ